MKRAVAIAVTASALVMLAHGVETAAARVTCPRVDDVAAVADAAVAVHATRRLVPREYARLSSMGHVAWRHFRIEAAISLGRTYAVAHPAPRLRALARRICGNGIAGRSWAVVLRFPDCQLPCSEDVAFLAHERSGWRIWYSEFHRP